MRLAALTLVLFALLAGVAAGKDCKRYCLTATSYNELHVVQGYGWKSRQITSRHGVYCPVVCPAIAVTERFRPTRGTFTFYYLNGPQPTELLGTLFATVLRPSASGGLPLTFQQRRVVRKAPIR